MTAFTTATRARSDSQRSASSPAATQPAVQEEKPLLVFSLPRSEVVIRAGRHSDMRALEWHGGADLRSFYEELWKYHSADAVCLLVADFNTFPIGMAVIHWHGKATHPHVPDLQSLRVMPTFRRMGIGSRLLQAAEDLVRHRGHPQLSLSVSTDNLPARRLYERLEYSVVRDAYTSTWHYINAHGQRVRVEETVLDMIKTLHS